MKFNFNKNKVVGSLEDVPEDFRGLYVADGDTGKFKLDTDDPKVKSSVSAIIGLNTALVASRAEAEAARGNAVDLSALSDFGDTPEAIAETVTARIAEAGKAAKGKGNEDKEAAVKAAQDAMAQKHTKDLELHSNRNTALTSQLHGVLVTGAATSALAAAKAIDVDLVMPHVINQVTVQEDNGKFTVAVINPDKTPRYSGTTAQPMTIEELVTDMKGADKYKSLFASENASGGGANPAQRNNPVPTGDNRSSTGKIESGLAAGQHLNK